MTHLFLAILAVKFFCSLVCETTLVIRYENASLELLQRIESGYSDNDYLKAFSLKEKGLACDIVLQSPEYIMISPGSKIPYETASVQSETVAEGQEQSVVQDASPEKTLSGDLMALQQEPSPPKEGQELTVGVHDELEEIGDLNIADQTGLEEIQETTIEVRDAAPEKTQIADQNVVSSIPSHVATPESENVLEHFDISPVVVSKALLEGIKSPSKIPVRRSRERTIDAQSSSDISTRQKTVVIELSSSEEEIPDESTSVLPQNVGSSTPNTVEGPSFLSSLSVLPTGEASLKLEEVPVLYGTLPGTTSLQDGLLLVPRKHRSPRSKTKPKFVFRYKKRKIGIGNKTFYQYVLKCLDTKDKKLFVTYALRKSELFLLETRKYARGLAVIGLIPASSAVIDFSRPLLLTAFLRHMEIAEDDEVLQVPRRMSLCFMNMSEHLRLCASTFHTLVTRGYFTEYARKVNYVTVDSHSRCFNRTVEITRGVRAYNARVVPCSVNNDLGYEDSQFYVLPDLQRDASVFILLRNNKELGVINVEVEIENIDVLFQINFSAESGRRRALLLSRVGSSSRKRKPGDAPDSSDNLEP